MTPAAPGWTEADYYRASRACRRAWEARDDQLQIRGVLEEGLDERDRDALPASVSPSSSSSSSPAVMPHRLPAAGGLVSTPIDNGGARSVRGERAAVREETDR